MPTVYVPIALPAAGKTTFGNRLAEKLGGSLLSMGADDVRERLYPGYSEGKIPFESMDLAYTFDVAYEWATDILRNGYDLWWDAVNTNIKHRGMVIENCRPYADRIVAVELNVPFDLIVERNATIRQGHRRPPLATLETMRDQMACQPVSLKEGFDSVWRFRWENDAWRIISHSPHLPALDDPLRMMDDSLPPPRAE